MTTEPWHKHTPGDPMPCKYGESVLLVLTSKGGIGLVAAKYWDWGKPKNDNGNVSILWRFVKRKGDDAANPYDALEWDEDDTTIVPLEKPGQPKWVRDDDLVRFSRGQGFIPALNWSWSWGNRVAFQIKRRPVLTPAVPQVLEMLSIATHYEADAIRAAARRANIEVPG